MKDGLWIMVIMGKAGVGGKLALCGGGSIVARVRGRLYWVVFKIG